jgi:hypothetical protein
MSEIKKQYASKISQKSSRLKFWNHCLHYRVVGGFVVGFRGIVRSVENTVDRYLIIGSFLGKIFDQLIILV